MTGLDLVSVQDVIAEHIRNTFTMYDVKEDEVLDDEYLLKISNKVKPFIVLRWSGLYRSPINGSFGGVRHDEYSSAVDIVIVAPLPKIARRALNMVMDELIGWQVPGGSPLTPEGGSSIAPVVDRDGRPHLYVAVNTLSFAVNSSGVGEYIGS